MTKVLSEVEAAPYVGLAIPTLQQMRVKGNGPAFLKLGRAVRYRQSDLDEWLEKRVVRSTSDAAVA